MTPTQLQALEALLAQAALAIPADNPEAAQAVVDEATVVITELKTTVIDQATLLDTLAQVWISRRNTQFGQHQNKAYKAGSMAERRQQLDFFTGAFVAAQALGVPYNPAVIAVALSIRGEDCTTFLKAPQ